MKKCLSLAVSAALILSLSACTFTIGNKDSVSSDDYDYGYDYGYSSYEDDVSSETDAVSSEDAAEQFGNEQVGWFKLNDEFIKWYTPGNSDTCVQFAKSPYEILTMDVIDCAEMKEQYGVDFDARVAASSRMYSLQQSAETDHIEKITGATEPLGTYDAYQVYCYYTNDQQYLVMWYMDSPDKTKVYYVAAEFRDSEMDFFNYAQTYQMPQ